MDIQQFGPRSKRGAVVPSGPPNLQDPSNPFSRPDSKCKLCSQKEAVHLCTCIFPPLPLCQDCTDKHRDDEYWNSHPLVSIKALPHFQSLDYMENLGRRQKGVKVAFEKAKAIEASIDVARKKLDEHFEQIIEAVFRCKDEKIRQLDEVKARLTSVLTSAKETVGQFIYHNTFASDNWLNTAIWNYSQNPVPLGRYTFSSSNQVVLEILDQLVYMKLDIGEECIRSEVIPAFPIVKREPEARDPRDVGMRECRLNFSTFPVWNLEERALRQ